MKYYTIRMRDKKEFEVNEMEYEKIKANMGSGAFIIIGNSRILNPADIMYTEYTRTDLPKLEETNGRLLTPEEKTILGEQMKKFKPKFLSS